MKNTFQYTEVKDNKLKKSKKVLIVATITAHIKGFHIPYIKWLKEKGYEVNVASNGKSVIEGCDKHFNLTFTRNPISFANLKAYTNLRKIIKNNNYDIIHCHTPVGGLLTRLAVKNTLKKKELAKLFTQHMDSISIKVLNLKAGFCIIQ